MKVMVLIFAFPALFVNNIEAQNRPQWQAAVLNRNQSNPSSFNLTQWNTKVTVPSADRVLWLSQYNLTGPSRSNGSQRFNRTHWQNQVPSRDHSYIVRNLTVPGVGPNSQRFNRTLYQSQAYTKLHTPIVKRWVLPANTTWNQTTHNGDVIIGQIGYLDRLLFNQTFRKEGRWWSGREKIIEYPIGNGYRRDTITAIRIYNKFLDGLESRAQVLSGGVGYRYVKIKLSSPWNRGFEYVVQLFGR